MGLSTSSCMSSSAISSAVFTPINKKKKLREIFPNTSSNSCDDKQSLCKIPRRKDRPVPNSMPPLKIDTAQCDDSVMKADCRIRMVAEETDQCSSLDSRKFIESNDREVIVAYSYSHGMSRQYTLHDDPTYFIGWEVHIEGEGVGFILSCLGPFFSGVRFEVQLQDGRVLVVPFSQGGVSTDTCEEMNITFLQRIF